MTVSHQLERVKGFIRYFIEEYEPICCLCGDKISWESFFPRIAMRKGYVRDEFTIHHLDHDRSNNLPSNKKISHRDCHRRHHRIEQRYKETHPTFTYEAFLLIKNKIKKIKYIV